MRRLPLLVALAATHALAGIQVPADVGVGPAGFWFPGPLLDNRGWVPHFALAFNVHAIIDKETVEQNWDRIPQKYRGLAAGVTEMRVGPSIFIPDTLYLSPKLDALGGTGLYGLTWNPIGLTLSSSPPTRRSDWNKSRGRYYLDANLLLTYLFIYSDFSAVPTTHFLRPGLELKLTLLLAVTQKVLFSLGGGAQVYIPQRLGSFLEAGPLDQSLWIAGFAFLKMHVRFPYEVAL